MTSTSDQCLLLIFVAVRVDFCPAVFYTVCAASHLKVWWSIWHLLTCHRLRTFVYKYHQFVPI